MSLVDPLAVEDRTESFKQTLYRHPLLQFDREVTVPASPFASTEFVDNASTEADIPALTRAGSQIVFNKVGNIDLSESYLQVTSLLQHTDPTIAIGLTDRANLQMPFLGSATSFKQEILEANLVAIDRVANRIDDYALKKFLTIPPDELEYGHSGAYIFDRKTYSDVPMGIMNSDIMLYNTVDQTIPDIPVGVAVDRLYGNGNVHVNYKQEIAMDIAAPGDGRGLRVVQDIPLKYLYTSVVNLKLMSGDRISLRLQQDPLNHAYYFAGTNVEDGQVIRCDIIALKLRLKVVKLRSDAELYRASKFTMGHTIKDGLSILKTQVLDIPDGVTSCTLTGEDIDPTVQNMLIAIICTKQVEGTMQPGIMHRNGVTDMKITIGSDQVPQSLPSLGVNADPVNYWYEELKTAFREAPINKEDFRNNNFVFVVNLRKREMLTDGTVRAVQFIVNFKQPAKSVKLVCVKHRQVIMARTVGVNQNEVTLKDQYGVTTQVL